MPLHGETGEQAGEQGGPGDERAAQLVAVGGGEQHERGDRPDGHVRDLVDHGDQHVGGDHVGDALQHGETPPPLPAEAGGQAAEHRAEQGDGRDQGPGAGTVVPGRVPDDAVGEAQGPDQQDQQADPGAEQSEPGNAVPRRTPARSRLRTHAVTSRPGHAFVSLFGREPPELTVYPEKGADSPAPAAGVTERCRGPAPAGRARRAAGRAGIRSALCIRDSGRCGRGVALWRW